VSWNRHRRTLRLRAVLFFAFLPAGIPAETPTAPTVRADTPIGHWVAEHPSKNGIGSWWDFRPDGTFTMHIGAVVTSPIIRSGDTFTTPPPTIHSAPITVTFHIDGDTLHIKSANAPEQIFARIGPAPSAADPLLGKWKPIPPATLSADPNIAAEQKLMANSVLAFFADNTESLRIPFSNYQGTWDATTHTFQVNNQAPHAFQRTGPKLTLGHPPDSRTTNTYLPDPVL